MKCLVYCILRSRPLPRELLPVGVDGKKVSLLHEDGLAAAFSLVDDACDTPELSRVKAYAAVIEALHRACTVLPMRYGCLLPSETHLAALLRERREEFLARLDEVQGCVEMAIRVLLEPIGTVPITDAEGVVDGACPPRSSSPPALPASHIWQL